jgi:hypothetical protein
MNPPRQEVVESLVQLVADGKFTAQSGSGDGLKMLGENSLLWLVDMD